MNDFNYFKNIATEFNSFSNIEKLTYAKTNPNIISIFLDDLDILFRFNNFNPGNYKEWIELEGLKLNSYSDLVSLLLEFGGITNIIYP